MHSKPKMWVANDCAVFQVLHFRVTNWNGSLATLWQ